jgi:hypothetical protein
VSGARHHRYGRSLLDAGWILNEGSQPTGHHPIALGLDELI